MIFLYSSYLNVKWNVYHEKLDMKLNKTCSFLFFYWSNTFDRKRYPCSFKIMKSNIFFRSIAFISRRKSKNDHFKIPYQKNFLSRKMLNLILLNKFFRFSEEKVLMAKKKPLKSLQSQYLHYIPRFTSLKI